MRNRLIAAAFALVAFCGAQAAFAAVSAVYNPATGNITLSGLVNTGGIQLKGPGVPTVAPGDLGGFAEVDGTTVNWLFFTQKQGTLDLGNLLPTGLLQTAIVADYFVGTVTAGSGDPTPAGAPITGGIVPEPGTIGLAGMGLIGLAVRRRRA